MDGRDQHQETVRRLAGGLSRLWDRAGECVVVTDVRCQLLEGFPTCVTAFDVAVVSAAPRWLVSDRGPMLGPSDSPCVGINIVSAETLEEDTIRTPNILARTAVAEYVLFDPTGEVLRPSFQTFWKEHGELNRSWPALKGAFFSATGFRLDLNEAELVVSSCGPRHIEEELFVLRWERDRLGMVGRDARIAQLESRLRHGGADGSGS